VTVVSLEQQASDFAENLTHMVRAIAPTCAPFRATLIEKKDGQQGFTVRQAPSTGIPLAVGGEVLFRLQVAYKCSLERAGLYLAVDESEVKVFPKDSTTGEPLFRYEYDRDAVEDMPAAHIQLHAHRDAFSYVLCNAGLATDRGKRRATLGAIPRISDLHFPVGGHRFRPCLEDVLTMLVHEFGVDSDPDGRKALQDGRENWRRKQLRAAVRDAPAEAASVLRSMGYDVVLRPDEAEPAENTVRLRDF
jgi:hypothetical protein